MRRRGYSPEAIRAFAEMIGVAKANSTVDIGKLEYCVRDDLNRNAPRVLGVLRPLRVTITNWDVGKVEELTAPLFPADIGKPGERGVPFGRELMIDRDDFMKDPPKDYLRLAPGRTVRLRHGYCITCDNVIEKDGEVVGLECRYLEGTAGKNPEGVKVWGVLHWVSAVEALPAEIRLYDRLFKVARPEDAEGDFVQNLNAASLEVVRGAMVEPSLARAAVGSRWQLERVGYFVVDPDSRPGALVLNRVITLKDEARKEEAPAEAREKSAKAKTRPPKKSGAEYRAEARNRDAYLAAAYDRLQREGLTASDADIVAGDRATLDFFTAAVDAAAPASASVVAGWIVNEVPRVLGDRPIDTIDAKKLGQLVLETDRGAIARPAAKEILARLAEGGDLDGAAAATIDDDAIAALVDDAIAKNPDKVAAYRGGKTGLLGFFVGQVVKASQGKASPPRVQALLAQRLSS
jgi:glutaminyl-tRNA synthetase